MYFKIIESSLIQLTAPRGTAMDFILRSLNYLWSWPINLFMDGLQRVNSQMDTRIDDDDYDKIVIKQTLNIALMSGYILMYYIRISQLI